MNKKLFTYLAILLVMFIISAYGSLFYPHSAVRPNGPSLEPPSRDHILGTDDLGTDIFAQISKGFFTSLFVGVATAFLAMFLGGSLGLMGGYLGGKTDLFISFLINLFLSLPQLPVIIVAGAFLGQSIINVIFIIALFSWAGIAKVVRAKTRQIRENTYLQLARSYGAGFFYLFKKHLFADIFPLLLINSLAVVGKAILQEASLAFLGLSDPLARSWGLIINKAMNFSAIYYTNYWLWWLLPPVFSLVVTLYCLRLLTREIENIVYRSEL
ncbi:MAG: ABC transporter permease [Firmicutes bacterium]|nr:ABC transporter permease [Bacillota bacterium]